MLPDLVHRIFLAPIRRDLDYGVAHEHWTSTHAGVFGATPGLLGYVQNRPPQAEWSGRTHVCAETFYESRDAEKQSFASDYYQGVVVEDENRFVQRDGAWIASVSASRRARQQLAYRVFAFGHDEHTAADWLSAWDPDDIDVFALSRLPATNSRASVIALWTDDLSRATEAVMHFGPLSFLAQPVPIVRPPLAPWST